MQTPIARTAKSRKIWLLSFAVAAFTLVVAVLAFALAFPRSMPFGAERFEALHYKVLGYLPQPEHTEFLPTPLPTSVAAARPTQTVALSLTPAPTNAPPQAAKTNTNAPAPPTAKPTATATQSVALKSIQAAVQLTGITHDYQRWNNCGPTTLAMYMSYFGKKDPQLQIAALVKPDPDDKNVNPSELAAYARGAGMGATVRVNGTIDRLKLFLSNGLPLMVETGFDPPRAHEGWMGHYRLVTGYDSKNFNTMDSYDGPGVLVDINALEADWRAFNRTYFVIYTSAQEAVVRAIIGDDWNDAQMYANAAARAQRELDATPNDPFAAFNLGSSLDGLKRYDEAASAFDKARLSKLPWRMMWYQFGPYEAYLQVGRYAEVVALADATLKGSDNLEESHYYKAMALEKLGRNAEAKTELAIALRYNKNFQDAQRALAQLEKP